MKPWSHLVERIRTRTGELHDLIHYPTPHSSSAAHSDLEMSVLELERNLRKMGKRVGGVVDEVYESVGEAVDGVQHSLKKQERKSEKSEGKVREVDEVVGGMNAKLNKSPERGHRVSLNLDRRMLIRCLRMCFRSGFWALTRRTIGACMVPLYTRPHP